MKIRREGEGRGGEGKEGIPPLLEQSDVNVEMTCACMHMISCLACMMSTAKLRLSRMMTSE